MQIGDGQKVTKMRQIRGLLRCKSNRCRNIRYKNRDFVGATNILRCMEVNKRPKALTRVEGLTNRSIQENFYLTRERYEQQEVQ